MLPIRKKDKVIVKAGKDKGKKGEVLKVFPVTSLGGSKQDKFYKEACPGNADFARRNYRKRISHSYFQCAVDLP